MLERARLGHGEQPGRPRAVVGAEHRGQLIGGPHVEPALVALGVGVQRGGEPALGGRQLAQAEVRGLAGDPLPQPVAGLPPPMQVRAQQQRVVVQHLLEVRHHPGGVDRVPREAAAELVVHAPARHRGQRLAGHDQRPLARCGAGRPGGVTQQELQHHRRRELGSPSESLALLVELPCQRRDRGSQLVVTETVPRLGTERPQPRHHVGADPAHLLAPVRPRVGERSQHLDERRHAALGLAREVGPAEEGLAVGRQHAGHRPSALTGHRLGGGHVDRVDIGSLLAVDLDAHEVLVEVVRGLVVLERLVRHDVAPVAGGVADAEQHGHVPRARLLEGVVAPLPPVDRVVGVLEQVRAGGACQAVAGAHPARLGAGQARVGRRPPPGGSSPSRRAGSSVSAAALVAVVPLRRRPRPRPRPRRSRSSSAGG